MSDHGIKQFVILIAMLLTGASVSAGEAPWEMLLAQANLQASDLQIKSRRFYGMGRYSLNTFREVWEDWMRVDSTTQRLGKEFLAASGSCHKLLSTAAKYNDSFTAIDMPPSAGQLAAESGAAALFQAISNICNSTGQPLSSERQKELKQTIATIPPQAAARAALVLNVVPEACRLRNESLKNVAKPDQYAELFKAAVELTNDYRITGMTRNLLEKGNLKPLTAGALKLARAVDDAIGGKRVGLEANFSFSFATPIGLIAINGIQSNVYPQADYLLILDCGGDDVYHGGATTGSTKCPVSVLIDFGGNDRYESAGTQFGVGILGYGLLVDCGGKDVYRSTRGVGYCAWGVGLVADLGTEDDSYEVEANGPAFGANGLAIVNDLGGNDRYWCRWQGIGCAKVGACAALVDKTGNDTYEADDKKIDYPSPQTKAHNANLSLGCGYGRRAHPGDGYSLAGGIGLLVDGSGNDSYSSGVFGQGVGYWFGLGILVDFGGNDQHAGAYYSQGAAAHYAVGALYDFAGDDHYFLLLNQGQGHGRDYSIGLLHDSGGNDIFKGPGSSTGNSNMNSIGLFWKEGGNADFQCPGSAPGSVNANRPDDIGLGLFRAEGGKFTFKADEYAGPGRFWNRPLNPKWPRCHGLGKSD